MRFAVVVRDLDTLTAELGFEPIPEAADGAPAESQAEYGEEEPDATAEDIASNDDGEGEGDDESDGEGEVAHAEVELEELKQAAEAVAAPDDMAPDQAEDGEDGEDEASRDQGHGTE